MEEGIEWRAVVAKLTLIPLAATRRVPDRGKARERLRRPRSRLAAASPIKVAILSDCKGAFGVVRQPGSGRRRGRDVAQFAGAKPKDPNKPRKGWTGGSISGHPLKLVGIGCANDRADTAIKETKRLMEQLDADIMIGPLSGDESIAVANYAKAASRTRRSSTAPPARRTRR